MLDIIYLGLQDPHDAKFYTKGDQIWFISHPQIPIQLLAILTPPTIGRFFRIADIRIGRNSLLGAAQALAIADVPLPFSHQISVGQAIGVCVEFMGYEYAGKNVKDAIEQNKKWETFYEGLINEDEKKFYKEITKRNNPFLNKKEEINNESFLS